jgi:hypothetical protein
MFRSRTRSVIVALLVAVFCTATAGPPVHAAPPDNPFAGSWAGRFETDHGFRGPVSMTIKPNGLMSGQVTYYPGGGSGILIGHVNESGFGAFVALNPPDLQIPYLWFVTLNESGQMEFVAPVPWDGGFTVFAILDPQ